MRFTLVWRVLLFSLGGSRPFKDSSHELYTHLHGLWRILEGCRPFKDSQRELYTSLEGLR